MSTDIFLFRASPISFYKYFIVFNENVLHICKYISKYFVLFYATVNRIIPQPIYFVFRIYSQ